jgi:hypothetical protein
MSEPSNADDMITEFREPRDLSFINIKDPALTYLPAEGDIIGMFNSLGNNRHKLLRPEVAYQLGSRMKYPIPVMNNQGKYLDLMRHNRDLFDQNTGTLMQQPSNFLDQPILSRESSYLGKRTQSVPQFLILGFV